MPLLGDVTIDRIERVAASLGDQSVLRLCRRAKDGDEQAVLALEGLLREARDSINEALRSLGSAVKTWAVRKKVDFKIELCDQATPERALITLEENGEWVNVWWNIPEGFATLDETLDQMLRKLRSGAIPINEAC